MALCDSKSSSTEVHNLEISRERDRIKISLSSHQAGEMQTVRHIEELAVSMDLINTRCREMVATLNQANRQGNLSPELLGRLKETGQLFRDDLFSAHIKAQLSVGKADQLTVTLDDQLVHIPWELLHDGEQFICQRYSMGRVVRTRQPIISRMSRAVKPPLQILVLADPCGDLKSAYEEGIGLRNFMDGFQDQLWVAFRSEGLHADLVKAKIRNYDWVHFAGHTDYDQRKPEQSGWRLSRGILTAGDIIKMAGTSVMPALVFSNACQSARTESLDGWHEAPDRIFGLANAFILAGVKHYVGTFWEIPDATSQHFAIAFYRFLLNGLSVGAAIRAARQVLIDAFGEENVIWASYLLYGDPSVVYLEKPADEAQEAPSLAAASKTQPDAIAATLRSPEEVIHFPAHENAPHRFLKRNLIRLGFALLILFIVFFAAIKISSTHKIIDHDEKQALLAFQAGNYDEAEQTCRRLHGNAPDRALSHLLLGNISFYKGDLEAARLLYQNAMKADIGSMQDKAEALMGMGRIASVTGHTRIALHYYRQAAEIAPTNGQPFLAQALLFEQQGDIHKAVELLQFAKNKSNLSDSAAIEALADHMEFKIVNSDNRQRQKRIDQMVKELQSQTPDAMPPQPSRQWSSRPLTIWFMDLEPEGYSLQEGSSVLLTGDIAARLLAQKRWQLVERDLMEKLMAELRLSSSQLAGLETRLQLGRLVAARLIIYGRMIHKPPQVQVTLRCIETETSRIPFVVNATFDKQTSSIVMADRIAEAMRREIQKQYPIRAQIVEQRGNKLFLDIGRNHGVSQGLRLKAVDSDLVLRVLDVESDQCTAKITAGQSPVEIGLRLEEFR